MDLEKYIESGILEFYIFDLLTKEEEIKVEENMVLFPRVKKELTEIENALFTYSMTYARVVPSSIKSQILTEIKELTK